MYLESLTWETAQSYITEKTITIIPVGSICQHGPGCPLGTDYVVPTELVRQIDDEYKNEVLVLPAVPFGVCDNHMDFCGTISVGDEVFYSYMSEITKSMMKHGARKFLFHNGNAGNDPVLNRVALDIYNAGGLSIIFNWQSVVGQIKSDWQGGHGGAQEIAMIMHLRPEWTVSVDFAEDRQHLSNSMRSESFTDVKFNDAIIRINRSSMAVSGNGHIKGPDDPPSRANDKWGRRMFETIGAYTNNLIEEFIRISR